ncbi:unnamed protein product [Heterobilharzia americana]|nr:unnamed protein product [Heterobilharzia americana]
MVYRAGDGSLVVSFRPSGPKTTKVQNNHIQKVACDKPQSDVRWALWSHKSLPGTLRRNSLPRCGQPGSVNRPHNSISTQVSSDCYPPSLSIPSNLPSRLSTKNTTFSSISCINVALLTMESVRCE